MALRNFFGGTGMKSFRNYAKNNSANGESAETLSAEELTKKIASAYNGKSSADILRNILEEAERSKRAGTLSDEEIEKFLIQTNNNISLVSVVKKGTNLIVNITVKLSGQFLFFWKPTKEGRKRRRKRHNAGEKRRKEEGDLFT